MQNKLALLFTSQTRESHKQYCTHTHTCWDRSSHWDEERLIMSSTTVWIRSQLLINKLMCRFGNLTLIPASFSLYLLFLYFSFSSSSMSVNAQSLHMQQTQNNNDIHRYDSRFTQYIFLKYNKRMIYYSLGDNSHHTGRTIGWSCLLERCDCVLNQKVLHGHMSREYFADATQPTTFFFFMNDNLHFTGTLKGLSYCLRQCRHILLQRSTNWDSVRLITLSEYFKAMSFILFFNVFLDHNCYCFALSLYNHHFFTGAQMEKNIILPEARNTIQPLQGWIPQ